MADAGGDKVIILPQNMVSVDGSRSKDDHKIVRYQWTREADSLAAGVSNSYIFAIFFFFIARIDIQFLNVLGLINSHKHLTDFALYNIL